VIPLQVTAAGRQRRQVCRTNASGFPDKAPKSTSTVAGLRTGAIVRAIVPTFSSKAGGYMGRLAVRATGACTIRTAVATVHGVHIRYCQPLHRGDGYAYQERRSALTPHASRQGSPRRVF